MPKLETSALPEELLHNIDEMIKDYYTDGRTGPLPISELALDIHTFGNLASALYGSTIDEGILEDLVAGRTDSFKPKLAALIETGKNELITHICTENWTKTSILLRAKLIFLFNYLIRQEYH